MEKVSLLTRVIFHISNILLIVLYLYPGSIMGWLLYNNIQKQPQITSDHVLFSSNHIYAFLIISILGLFSYYSKNIKILFLYLFSISIFLELLHYVIPQRSFELKDLFGNFFGVLIIFLVFNIYKFFKKIL
jgi:glycopeptide antibiotics resistance protein